MKIVFFGDSITDAGKCTDYKDYSYGNGYLGFVAGELLAKDPLGYDLINCGIASNSILDLYYRMHRDVWPEKPDLINILVGINDLYPKNGVSPKRFESIYRAIITETREQVPGVRFLLCEPFCLPGSATLAAPEVFARLPEYAGIVRRLAEEYDLPLLSLQDRFNGLAEKYPPSCWLWDGVHPTRAGAKIMADEWLAFFRQLERNEK